MYPKVVIYLNQIIENMKQIKEACESHGIKMSAVTKLLSGNKEIVSALVKNGVDCICDSKIENLKTYQDLHVEKWLIRLPSLSEIAEVVKYADASLNSELSTIQALDEEAKKQGKIHKVILMYEIGDLREGCLKEELFSLFKQCLTLSHIEVYGIGVNLSCYGEIMPDKNNMQDLATTVSELEEQFSTKFQIVSGGNSSSYLMMLQNQLPAVINNLRIGETIYLGDVPCVEQIVPSLHQDNFVLQAQIIELKEKPSMPWGTPGNTNSFGEHHAFEDKGIRKRAIIGLRKTRC